MAERLQTKDKFHSIQCNNSLLLNLIEFYLKNISTTLQNENSLSVSKKSLKPLKIRAKKCFTINQS